MAQEENWDKVVCGVEFPISWFSIVMFTGNCLRTLTGPRGVASCKRDVEAMCHTVKNTGKDWDIGGFSLPRTFARANCSVV